MRRLLTILLLTTGCLLGEWGNGYTRRIVFTVDHTKVGFIPRLDRTGWTAGGCEALGNTPDRAINASVIDQWVCSGYGASSFITIDMQSAQTFDVLYIDTNSDVPAQYATSWEIYVSDDGTTWGSAIASGSWTSVGLYKLTFASQTKRHIKMVFPTGAGSYMRARQIWPAYTGGTDTPLLNHPVLINGTFASLAHTDHGGYATDEQGDDIIFTSDTAGSTPLYWEIESYNHETGAIIAHVRAPSLSMTADTPIYCFVGNASVTTFQSTVANVWSKYKQVMHFADIAGTVPSVVDSSGNHDAATVGVYNNPDVPGMIGNAVDGGDGGSAWAITFPDRLDQIFNGSNNKIRISYWAKWDPAGTIHVIRSNIFGGVNAYPVRTVLGTDGGTDEIQFLLTSGNWFTNNAIYTDNHNLTITKGVWYNVVQYIDLGTPANSISYFNASNWGTGYSTAGTAPTVLNAPNSALGLFYGPQGGFDGQIDEFRISLTAPTDGEALTDYNMQLNNSTFISAGDAIEGTATRRRVVMAQ